MDPLRSTAGVVCAIFVCRMVHIKYPLLQVGKTRIPKFKVAEITSCKFCPAMCLSHFLYPPPPPPLPPPPPPALGAMLATLGELTEFRLAFSGILAHINLWREREMFYLTTHSTHFIYGYTATDIWLRTIQIVREETRFRHIGYSYRLTARVLLYAPSHRQDNTYISIFLTCLFRSSLEREQSYLF